MVFHGAARSVIDGHIERLADGHRFTGYLNTSYGFWLTKDLAFRPWVYPPSYLLFVLPFGLTDLVTSYAVFQIATAALLVAVIVAGSGNGRRRAWVVAAGALLCPAAAANAACGQNAFLIAAIVVAGVRLLSTRPLLAGAILGLATIKPQFAIFIPVALIAGRQWRALVAAGASALLLAAASALAFGLGIWIRWVNQTMSNLTAANSDWTIYGRLWGDLVWTCAVLVGLPASAASALSVAALIGAGAAVVYAFTRPMRDEARLAVLLAAIVLAAPYWSFYDAVLLTFAGLYWIIARGDTGQSLYPWIVVLILWLVPLVSPPVVAPMGRAVPLLLAGFLFLAARLGAPAAAGVRSATRTIVPSA